MTSVTVDNGPTGAVGEVTLTTTAFNIIKIDWTDTSTKVSIAKYYSTYLMCEHTKFTVNLLGVNSHMYHTEVLKLKS